MIHRTQAEQARLNSFMRRQDVLEHVLAASLHADPATPVQVRAFLATAPPEVFTLLDGLLPPPSQHDSSDASVHDHPIVCGLVGLVRSKGLPGPSRHPSGGHPTP